jgi:hypothetical protein
MVPTRGCGAWSTSIISIDTDNDTDCPPERKLAVSQVLTHAWPRRQLYCPAVCKESSLALIGA